MSTLPGEAELVPPVASVLGELAEFGIAGAELEVATVPVPPDAPPPDTREKPRFRLRMYRPPEPEPEEAPAAPAPPSATDLAWEALRATRRRGARSSRTLSEKRSSKDEMRVGRALFPPVDAERPKTRGECADAPRPCPWTACRYHLYLDVVESGSLRLNFPTVESWEIPETCALDVADGGVRTLEEVGVRMNLTRERVRQVEITASRKLVEAGLNLTLMPVREPG